MGISSIIGGNMIMGIRMIMDARGVSQGAITTERALDRIRVKASAANASVKQYTQSLSSQLMGQGMALNMIGMAATNAGKAIIGGFVKPSVDAAKTYQASLAQVKVYTHATEAEMVKFSNKIDELSPGRMFSKIDMADALGRTVNFFGSMEAGVKHAETLVDLMAVVGKEMSPEQTAEVLNGFFLKFQKTGITMQKISDVMVKAANVTPLKYEDYEQIMRSSRDIATVANLTFEDFVAIAGATKGALSPAEAGRGALMVARQMVASQGLMQDYAIKKGLSFNEAMEKAQFDKTARASVRAISSLGVSYYDAAGNQKPFMENLVEIQKRTKTMTQAERDPLLKRVFLNQGKAVIALLNDYDKLNEKSGGSVQKLSEGLKEVTGETKWAAKVVGDTYVGIEKRFEAAKTNLSIAMGTPLLQILAPIMEGLAAAMTKIGAFMDRNPEFAKSIGVVAIAFGGLFLVLGPILSMLGSISMIMAFMIPTLAATGVAATGAAGGMSFFGLSAVTALLPVLAILGVLYLSYKTFLDLADKDTRVVGTRLKEQFANIALVFKGVSMWWNGTGGKGSKALYKDLKNKGLLGYVEQLLQAKTKIVWFFEGLWKGLKPAFAAIGAMISVQIELFSGLIDIFNLISGNPVGTNLENIEGGIRGLGTALGWIGTVILAKVAAGFVLAGAQALGFAISTNAAIWPVTLALIALAAACVFLSDQKTWVSMGDTWADIMRTMYNAVMPVVQIITNLIDKMKVILSYSFGQMDLTTAVTELNKINNRKPFEPIKDTKEGRDVFQPFTNTQMAAQQYKDSIDPTMYLDPSTGIYLKKKPPKQVLSSEAQQEGSSFGSQNRTRADIATGGKVKERPPIVINVNATGAYDPKALKQTILDVFTSAIQDKTEYSHGH